MPEQPNIPTRRGVLKTSAWSVPALAAVVAAPASAASTGPCVPDAVLSSLGTTLRATNTGATPLTYTFSQLASADPLTMYVTSGGDTLAFNPDVTYSWPNTMFTNGAQVTFTRIDAFAGTFTVLIPAGGFVDFGVDSNLSAGCTPASEITITTVDCPLSYRFRQCVPF